ncbi:MAG: UvrD-helicase domain-containing protein [Halanaerobiaceae bacterium]
MKKVLKASAGTGKTYRLSLEYLAALFSGQDFTEIAVLTFTRKATAEARERILEHLQDLIDEGPDSEVWHNLTKVYPGLEYRPRLIESCRKQILLKKDALHIYTIDSFTNRIFRETVAPYLGVYDYQVVEGDENEQVIEEVFRRLLADADYFSLLEEIFAFGAGRNFDNVLNYLKTMVGERWKFLLLENKKREITEVTNILEPFEHCLQLLKEVAEKKQKEMNPRWFVSKFRDTMKTYLRLQDQRADKKRKIDHIIGNRDKFLKEDKTFWNGNKVRGKNFQDFREELKLQYNSFQKKLAGYIFNQEVCPLEQSLFNLAEKVFMEYDQLKQQQKLFTHSDISNYVYKYVVLGELQLPGGDLDSFLAQLMGNEISSLFIDEFQDTSVLQWKILENLVTPERNFIAVGDAKQSIYQWRGGEKELFVRLPEFIDCTEETLPVCYRSDREILHFVNHMFLDLQKDWAYEKVKPRCDADQGYVSVLLGGSNLYIRENTKKFAGYSEKKQAVIQKQNRNVKTDLPRQIVSTLKQKFTSYCDVAVLARRNKDLVEIAELLAGENIPYILHQEGDLLENKAVWPLYQLLCYLWHDEYHYLLNFLRSDLVQLPHSQLKFMLRKKEEIKQLLSENRSEVEEKLNWSKLAREYPELSAVLEWVLELARASYENLTYDLIAESGVISLWQEDRGALKNVFRFYSLLREQESLAEFMNFCRDESSSSRLQEVSVQGENAVDLLTVHKAKGLSFHSVLFYWKPGSRRGGNNSDDLNFDLQFSPDYNQITEYLLFPSRYSNLMPWLDFTFQKEAEKKELAEEINNVYVALTRAVHNLFVFVASPVQIMPGETGAWEKKERYGFYEPALLKACNKDSLTELITGYQKGNFVTHKEDQKPDIAKLKKAVSFFRPDQSSAARSAKEEVVTRERDSELDLKGEVNRIRGLAIHYFLEHITTGNKDECQLARKMVAARFGNILGPKKMEEIINSTEEFIANNPQYFDDRWQVFTEYEPVVHQKAEEKEKARIDRLLVDKQKKELVILDYKSGFTRKEEQLARYRDLMYQEVGPEYEIKTEFVLI